MAVFGRAFFAVPVPGMLTGWWNRWPAWDRKDEHLAHQGRTGKIIQAEW